MSSANSSSGRHLQAEVRSPPGDWSLWSQETLLFWFLNECLTSHYSEKKKRSATERFIAFTGLKTQQDLRNQTNRILQQGDLRTGKLKNGPEQTLAHTPGMPRVIPRSTGIGTGPPAPRTARTSSPGSLTRSLCPCRPIATRRLECPGLVSTAHTSTTPESRWHLFCLALRSLIDCV